jgi:methyltransferase
MHTNGGIGSVSPGIGPVIPILLLLFLILPFMLVETIRSMWNERRLRQRGAIEPPDDVYPVMSVVYPFSFVAMAIEGARWGGPRLWLPLMPIAMLGLWVFVLAKLLKFWAILTLGERWTFRVLVPPGAPLIARGPYRFLRHPNYVAVIGELVGTAIMMPAPITGVLFTALFAWLVMRRIAVEERALGIRT